MNGEKTINEINISIEGSGQVSPGCYGTITVNGSAKGTGAIRAAFLSVSGCFEGGETLEVDGKAVISGALSCPGDVSSYEAKISGSARIGGGAQVRHLDCSGSFEADSLRCSNADVTGSVRIRDGIEAETFRCEGMLSCGGLLNAEVVEIRHGCSGTVGTIGGRRIVITHDPSVCRVGNATLGLFGLSKWLNRKGIAKGRFEVTSAIEGDDVTLEYVRVPRVSARRVTVGEGCEIAELTYTETASVSPSATVREMKKSD